MQLKGVWNTKIDTLIARLGTAECKFISVTENIAEGNIREAVRHIYSGYSGEFRGVPGEFR